MKCGSFVSLSKYFPQYLDPFADECLIELGRICWLHPLNIVSDARLDAPLRATFLRVSESRRGGPAGAPLPGRCEV